MDSSNLKYTIIIPCFNSEKWLSASIESALNQTYKNIEVIVIDNESSDQSLEIARRYSDRVIVGSAKNIYKHSYQEPVEEALSLATGDYFTILGSDDFVSPTYIEKSLYVNGTIAWDSEKYLGASDYDLYFRLADKGHFIFAYPEWLGYYYRWHEDQATWGMHKENALNNFDKMIQSYWKEKWNVET